MPSVAIGMWLFLSAGRMLVSRLPLLPNKDLLFANFAILLIGAGPGAVRADRVHRGGWCCWSTSLLIVAVRHPHAADEEAVMTPSASSPRCCRGLARAVPAGAQVLGSDAAACDPGGGPAILAQIAGLKDRNGELKLELYPANESRFPQGRLGLLAAGKSFRRVWTCRPRRAAQVAAVHPRAASRPLCAVRHARPRRQEQVQFLAATAPASPSHGKLGRVAAQGRAGACRRRHRRHRRTYRPDAISARPGRLRRRSRTESIDADRRRQRDSTRRPAAACAPISIARSASWPSWATS